MAGNVYLFNCNVRFIFYSIKLSRSVYISNLTEHMQIRVRPSGEVAELPSSRETRDSAGRPRSHDLLPGEGAGGEGCDENVQRHQNAPEDFH